VIAEAAIGDQSACGNRLAIGVERIAPQEHLMRGMGAVSLVLIDKRRSRIFVLMDVVGRTQHSIRSGPIGGPCQDHEAEAWIQIIRVAEYPVRSGDQWVVCLERNEDRAAAALGDEIEAVVEELAKERHPGVER